MKVLAIGGSGGMGRYAVATMQDFDTVERIVVADRNSESARGFAAQLSDKVSAIGLDVSDTTAMCEAMTDADLVVNTAGPFYRFGLPILQAAIDTKCHYIDICDDWAPTLKMLELDASAKAAGVCAIVGLGASPGITNMLALMALQNLDSVSTLYTGWDLGGATPEGRSSQEGLNAAMLHGIEQMTGKVEIYRNGASELVKPLAPVPVHFPGLPAFTGHIFGHPEAVTFPRNYPQLQESINLAHGGDIDSLVLRGILGLINWRLVSRSYAAGLLTWFEGQRTLPPKEKDDAAPPVMYGLAVGRKNSQPASVGVSWVGEAIEAGNESRVGMGAATGIPVACGVKFLSEGHIDATGVFSPEAGNIDPAEFLAEVFAQLARLGRLSSPDLDDHIKISHA